MYAGKGELQLELIAVHTPITRDASSDALAHDHHTALGAPALELQMGLHHLAAVVVRPTPIVSGALLGHQALHVLGLP